MAFYFPATKKDVFVINYYYGWTGEKVIIAGHGENESRRMNCFIILIGVLCYNGAKAFFVMRERVLLL
jgi:hypothetical protein